MFHKDYYTQSNLCYKFFVYWYNNNNNNLFTYIAPFNIYGMIKGALQSKKTNITIDNYNKNAIYNR